MIDTPLASYLRMIREQKNLTQNDLANVLGIKRAGYSHYEIGKNVPPVDKLRILADFYKIPLEKFVRLTGDEFVDSQEEGGESSSQELYSSYIKECADLNLRKLWNWMSLTDRELVFYFHQLSDRDKKILMEMAKMMAQQ